MKKTTIMLIICLLFSVNFLSGCSEFDLDDPLGIETSTEVCGLVVIIVVILFVILLIGLAKAGTKKDIVIQSPPAQQPVIIKSETKEHIKKESKSNRRCPECGRVIPEDAKMCPYCGKKFKSHFEEDKEETEPNDNKEETKKQSKDDTKPLTKCTGCGYKFEEEDLDFCPKCGIKLK